MEGKSRNDGGCAGQPGGGGGHDGQITLGPMGPWHQIWQYISHVFVCKSCGKKFKTNNRHKKLVRGKPWNRKSLCNSSMWG